MTELFESRHASCVIAVEAVPLDQTMHYVVVEVADGESDVARVIDLVEKPRRFLEKTLESCAASQPA